MVLAIYITSLYRLCLPILCIGLLALYLHLDFPFSPLYPFSIRPKYATLITLRFYQISYISSHMQSDDTLQSLSSSICPKKPNSLLLRARGKFFMSTSHDKLQAHFHFKIFINPGSAGAQGFINQCFLMPSSLSCGYPHLFDPPFGSYFDESDCLLLG